MRHVVAYGCGVFCYGVEGVACDAVWLDRCVGCLQLRQLECVGRVCVHCGGAVWAANALAAGGEVYKTGQFTALKLPMKVAWRQS